MHDRAIGELANHLAWVIRVQIGDNPDHSGPEDAAEKLAAAMVEQAENILLTGDWRNLARPAHGRADARYRPGPKDAPAPVPGH
jgi:hypothetical protein